MCPLLHIRKLSRSVTLALVGAYATAAVAQQPLAIAAQPIGYKDPELATVLGVLVVGGGQLYGGHVAKGATLLTVGYGSLIAGVAAAAHCEQNLDDNFGGSYTDCHPHRWYSWAGVGIFTASWVYGWATAANDAREHNAKATHALLIEPLWRYENGRTLIGLSFVTQ